MEQIFFTQPYSPVTIIGLFLGSIFIVLTFISRRRNLDMKTLRDSNDDLRSAIDDKGREIDKMREDIRDLRSEIAILQASNTTLQEIVNVALKEYFAENPHVVVQLSKSIKTKI